MISAPWAESNCALALAYSGGNCVHGLERKACPVLDRATVLVRAVVRHVLQELVDEVAIRGMKFDSIEPGAVHGVRSRLAIPLDVFFDLYRNVRRGRMILFQETNG